MAATDVALGNLSLILSPRVRRLGSPLLVDAKGSEYSRYNGELLLTPNRSEGFLAAGYFRSAGSRMLATVLMDSLPIDALLITEGESGMPLFERRDSPVHLAAEGIQ